MKIRFVTGAAMVLFAAGSMLAADSSWTGYISDSQCGAKGADEKQAECTTKCVKEHGAKYVFVNDGDKKVYAIDAQDKVAAHAGHHVTVKGTLEGDTLKLASIDMAAKDAPKDGAKDKPAEKPAEKPADKPTTDKP